jgi:geranylgeranyl diphosphate synthase type II
MLCGASEYQLAALREYGQSAGLAFQIADDMLDLVGDEEKLGRPVGSDLRQDKATFPKLFGLPESRRRAFEESQKAISALRALDERADALRFLARYIIERDL